MEDTVNINPIHMSNNISEITSALCTAQSELEAAKKDQKGYGYNYSDLNQVISVAKPVLASNGLAITQLVGHTNNNVEVTTILAHKSGEFFKSVASLPVIEMKGCNLAQSAGASISYLRRYAYQSILGMSSEDNDASSNGFSKASKSTEKKEEVKKVPFKRIKRGNNDEL